MFCLVGGTSDSNPTILTYDGRIDLNAVQSPTAIEKFDYDAMTISDLEIESDLENDVITECWDRTPMHVAVTEKNESVLRCFIEYKGTLLGAFLTFSSGNIFCSSQSIFILC